MTSNSEAQNHEVFGATTHSTKLHLLRIHRSPPADTLYSGEAVDVVAHKLTCFNSSGAARSPVTLLLLHGMQITRELAKHSPPAMICSAVTDPDIV
jgi:hypothetical protein